MSDEDELTVGEPYLIQVTNWKYFVAEWDSKFFCWKSGDETFSLPKEDVLSIHRLIYQYDEASNFEILGIFEEENSNDS